MVKVTFVSADGSSVDVEAPVGATLMECAVDNMIPEIEGQCGGACACGTCHCYLREEWVAKVEPKNDFEEVTLEGGLAEIKENSRLACQVVLTEELSGIVVDLPESPF